MKEIFYILYENTCNITEPKQWFPIVALVVLGIELHDLMYRSRRRLVQISQLSQEGLQRLIRYQYSRRILIWILSIYLAWILYFELFYFQRRGEQPRLANKLIDNNKINKEPKSDQTAHDRGVGSTALLAVFCF